jgi:hypothetical protein
VKTATERALAALDEARACLVRGDRKNAERALRRALSSVYVAESEGA